MKNNFLINLINETIQNGENIFSNYENLNIQRYNENLNIIFDEIIASTDNPTLRQYAIRLKNKRDIDDYKLSIIEKIIYDILFFLHKNQSWNTNRKEDLTKRYIMDMNNVLINLKSQL